MKFLPFALTLLLFVACGGSDNKKEAVPPSGAAAAQLETPPAPVVPEIYLYWVTVDNLLLRDQPTQKGSKVVTKFPKGDFVEGTGKVSDNKEEATIRKIPLIEPFFEVISTTPEQHKGWAFGGALQRVYAGPRATAPDLGQLSQFSMMLRNLRTNQTDSGKKAWEYVQANFKDSKGTLADAACVMLTKFLGYIEQEGDLYLLTEKQNWTQDDYEAVAANRFDMNKYPVTKQLAAAGFELAQGEGSIFPVTDTKRIADFFTGKVTPPMKKFLEQERYEFEHQAWSDGGIIIPIDQVADRAAFWEKFNREHPYFILSEQTRESQRWTTLVTLVGDSNTPSYDYETKNINEDFKKAWAYVQQKYAGTQLARHVKEFTDIIAAEGGKFTKKAEDYRDKYLLGEQQ
jgi:hypothetical protein